MEKIKSFFSGAGFKALILLLFVAVSIPITVYLIKQQQVVKSKASADPIKFTGSNVKVITDASGNIRQIATLEDIEVEVTTPTAANPSPSGFSLNGSVSCGSTASAVFSWDAVTGASGYVLKYLRDADGEWTTVQAGTAATKTVQLSPGPYARWSVTVNFTDNRTPQTKVFGEGFTCGGGSTGGASPSPTPAATATPTPAPTATPTPRPSACQSQGGAAILAAFARNEFSDLPRYYEVYGCLTRSQAEQAHGAAASYYQDCGVPVNEGQINDLIGGIAAGIGPARDRWRQSSCPQSSNGLLSLLQKFLPKEVFAQTVPAACNVHCPTAGSSVGCAPGYICVDDNGDKQCRGIACPANSNCECMAAPTPFRCDPPTVPYPEQNPVTCVNCNPNANMRYENGRCVPGPTPTPPTGAVLPPPSGEPAAGGSVPAGVTFTHFKISEADNDTGWSNASEYPISKTKVAYKFIAQTCITQPCDAYPRALRRVYVQFTGKKGSEDYSQVFSKDIMLALKPAAQSVSCELAPSSTGTTVTVKGLHFGTDIGGITVGAQNAAVAQTGAWINLQASGNITGSISAQSEVILTTADGQKTTALSCTPGQNTLNFKASLACSSVGRPLQLADIEIREKAIGVGSTAPVTPAVSVFKKDKSTFSAEGKPSDLTAKLIEGKEYELIIQSPNLLRRVVSFKAGKGTTNIDNIDLPIGDIESERGDCAINSFDRAQLLREWTRSAKTTTRADFNQDGGVNSLDLACLNSNFNKRCDTP